MNRFRTESTNGNREITARNTWILAAFVAGYLAAAEVGHLLSFSGPFASFWPPSGVYFAALLLAGRPQWPLLILGAMVGNVTSDVGFHGKTLTVSIGFWAANTVEAVASAVVIRRAVGMPFAITSLRHVAWFVIAKGIIGTTVAAFLGATVVVLAFGGSFLTAWIMWWISGVLGGFLVAPAILNAVQNQPWREIHRRRLVELICVLLVTAATAEFVFGQQTNPLAFLVLPVLVWSSIRYRVCGAVLTTVVIAAVAVGNTASGYGPFAGSRPILEQVLLTQGFLGTTIVLALILATLSMEHAASTAAVKQTQQELEEANVQLRFLAATDELTGVNNRRAFQKKLTEEVERAHRHETPLSIVMLDVDHFKLFNDQHGHPAGDSVLQAVARLLQQSARSTDFVARYGGEEFVIILTHTNESGSVQVAERFRQMIAIADWPQQNITISAGVSTLSDRLDTGALLVELADCALYESKRAGRNRVRHSNADVALRAASPV